MGTSLVRDPEWLAAVSAPVPGPPRVKVCGLQRADDVRLALELGADAVGFVCTPGLPRSVSPSEVIRITRLMDQPSQSKSVLVFRDPTVELVTQLIHDTCINRVQVHGAPAATVAAVRRVAAVVEATPGTGVGTALVPALWDSPGGGSGRALDWGRLLGDGAPPFTWIAGGITPENVGDLLRHRPWGIDVSSGIEQEPGAKDPAKLRSLFQEVRP